MTKLYKFKPLGSLKLIAPCCLSRLLVGAVAIALVVQTIAAASTTSQTPPSSSTTASSRTTRANQQQPAAAEQQQLSPAAAPFYSIKDSKTSARRIQKQQASSSQTKVGKPKQRDCDADGTNCNRLPSALSRPSSKLDNGEQQPLVDLNDLNANGFAANEFKDTAPGNPENDNNQLLQSAGDQQQRERQQMVNTMIDSFNQLVGSGQLDNLMSSFRGNVGMSQLLQQQQQVGGGQSSEQQQLSSTEGNVGANLLGDQRQQVISESTTNDLPTNKATNQRAKQQQAATKSKPNGANRAAGENNVALSSGDALGTTQSPQTPTPSSLSMSLDEMIVNSRPRASSKSISELKKQQASINQRLGEQKPLSSGADNEPNIFVTNGAQITVNANQTLNGKAPRRVPFSGVPFSSPASKGQRTKPKASNQFGGAADGASLFSTGQQEVNVNSESASINDQPSAGMNNGRFDDRAVLNLGVVGNQQQPRQQSQSGATKAGGASRKQANKSTAAKNSAQDGLGSANNSLFNQQQTAANQADNNNRNAQQPTLSQLSNRLEYFIDQQQQQQTAAARDNQLDGLSDDQVSVQQQENRLADGKDELDNLILSNQMDSFLRNGNNFTRTAAFSDMQPKLVQTDENGANGEMLMSVVSSQDGKERRLVMISRDTLNTLQRFAAQQLQNGGAAQVSPSPIASGQQQSSSTVSSNLPAITNGQPGAADSSLISGPANSWSTNLNEFGANSGQFEQQRQTELDSFQGANFATDSTTSATTTTTTTTAPPSTSTLATTTTTADSLTKSTNDELPSSTLSLINSGEQTSTSSSVATTSSISPASSQTTNLGAQSSFLEVPVQRQQQQQPKPASNGQRKGKTQRKQSSSAAGSAKTKQQQAAANGNGSKASPGNNSKNNGKQRAESGSGSSSGGAGQQSPSVNKQVAGASSATTGTSGPSSPSKVKSSSSASGRQQAGATSSLSSGGAAATKSGNNNGRKQQQKQANGKQQNNGTNGKSRKTGNGENDSAGTNRKTKTQPPKESAAVELTGGAGEQQAPPRSPIAQTDDNRQKQSFSSPSTGQSATDQVGQRNTQVGTRNGQQQQKFASTSTKNANQLAQQQQRVSESGEQLNGGKSIPATTPGSLVDSEGVRTSQQTFGGAISTADQQRPLNQLNRTVLAGMSKLEIDKHLDELERNNDAASANDGASNDSLDVNQPEDQRRQRPSAISQGFADSSFAAQLSDLEALKAAVPGEPLVDYPIYSAPPKSSFDCQAQSCPGGYYADLDSQCQVFHVCQNDGRSDTFLCPNGTIFSQQHFVCVWWWQVDCSQSKSFYSLNDGIYCNSMNLPPVSSGAQWAQPTELASGGGQSGSRASGQSLFASSNVGSNLSDNSLPQTTTPSRSSTSSSGQEQQTSGGDFSTANTGRDDATGTPTTSSPQSTTGSSGSLSKLFGGSGADDGRTTPSTFTSTASDRNNKPQQRQQQRLTADTSSESDLNEQQQQQLELLSRSKA